MLISELQIDDFGKFHGKEFDFDKGMNIIYGGNESGKSTIRAFIMFVLFGREPESDNDSANGFFDNYRSVQSGSCGGRIIFEYMGHEYIAERSLSDGGSHFSITDIEDGSMAAGDGGSISDLIHGLTPSRMRNTISIPQIYDDETDDSEREELLKKKAVIDEQISAIGRRITRDRNTDYEDRRKAADLIEQNNDIARQYKEKKAQLARAQERARAGRARNASASWDKYEDKRAELDDLRFTRDELRSRAEGSGFKALAFTFPIVAVAVLVWIMGASFGMTRMIRAAVCLAVVILALLVFLIVVASGSGKKRRARRLDKRGITLEREMQDILRQNGVGSREELWRLKNGGAGMAASEEEKSLRRELDDLRSRYNALQEPLRPYLAKYGNTVTLEAQDDPELKERLQNLKKQASDIEHQLDDLDNTDNSVSFTEPLPLVLDCFFSSYDDNRLKRTVLWLTHQTSFSQTIILTCHHREAQTLDEIGAEYRYYEIA